jgi:glycosyltransferase involved in cell wall biosynthesis
VKKILFIGQSAPLIHGQAMMTAQLWESMKSWSDFEVHHINACYAEDRKKLGGFSYQKMARLMGYLWQTLWCCSRHSIDTVVMTHGFFRGSFLKDSLFVWCLAALRKKIVVWIHMDPQRLLDGASPWWKWYARKVMEIPNVFVACAPSLIRQWPAIIPQQKIVALCNGIADPSMPVTRREDGKYRIVFLSSMTEEKGWKELLDAAVILCEENQEIIFDFYGAPGAGETEQHLIEVFSQTPFRERIRWHGGVWGQEKTKVLIQADLFCLPSWTEAFPLAVLEAMACSLPVLATRVGGIPDAIEHEESGWLVEPQNTRKLTETLRKAIAHKAQWKQMGTQNRIRFLAEFSDDAFQDRWRKLLRTVDS